MSLTAKDVAQITRLLEESSFDELYLELDGLKLSLRRGSAATAAAGDATPASPQAAQPASAGALQVTVSRALTDDGALTDPSVLTVSAPLLGTFYRAPKPGALPFVEVGSLVKEDTIVGSIEVMKLMNTVRAGIRGEVVEILARDGALVEYGEALMHVRKTS